MKYDHISCHNIQVYAFIGFRDFEQGIRQTLSIDVDVEIEPVDEMLMDSEANIKFDYKTAYDIIEHLFIDTHYKLIETVAQRICEILLQTFDIHSVKVSVSKRPIDMKQLSHVAFTCQRYSNENHK